MTVKLLRIIYGRKHFTEGTKTRSRAFGHVHSLLFQKDLHTDLLFSLKTLKCHIFKHQKQFKTIDQRELLTNYENGILRNKEQNLNTERFPGNCYLNTM